MSFELKMAYLCFSVVIVLMYLVYKLMKDDDARNL